MRVRDRSAITTVFFSLHQTGALLSWFECVELYHLTILNSALCIVVAASNGRGRYTEELKTKLLSEFRDVFDDSGPL